jgi:hypothetical protein
MLNFVTIKCSHTSFEKEMDMRTAVSAQTGTELDINGTSTATIL